VSASPGGVFTVGLAGPEIGPAEREALIDLQPGGVILFARNVRSLAQVSSLCGELDELLDRPLLVIDQEGGRVDRLKAVVGSSPPARRVAVGGPELVRRHSELMARACRVAGLNFNCAPVVDLDEGNEGNAIGDRAWGTNPDAVVPHARLVLEAHEREGVGTCLKHFPGLGRTRADTHEMRPMVRLGRDELLAHELRPFAALADEAPGVMVSHAAFAEVSGGDRPASLCPAVAALEAGCDLLLFCHDHGEARKGRDAIAEAGSDRLDEALRRVGLLRERFGGLPKGAGDEAACAAIRAELAALDPLA
jgi:beta-N-acetylhexosaminidase